ncbi:hypothetical protein INR49_004235 [Caranx melampygus]|nr:hypothetical protein INR49_004235 [Caranx melampygus]
MLPNVRRAVMMTVTVNSTPTSRIISLMPVGESNAILSVSSPSLLLTLFRKRTMSCLVSPWTSVCEVTQKHNYRYKADKISQIIRFCYKIGKMVTGHF